VLALPLLRCLGRKVAIGAWSMSEELGHASEPMFKTVPLLPVVRNRSALGICALNLPQHKQRVPICRRQPRLLLPFLPLQKILEQRVPSCLV
jgi:hypothetical protein